MRVLYVLHRYHTNQIATMKGWKEHGDDLRLLVQYSGGIEDHTYVTPEIIGYSKVYMAFHYVWVNWIRRKDEYAKDVRIRYSWPPRHKVEQLITEFNPDLVILRERSWYTMACYRICKKYGYKTLLFNLSPVWAEPSYWHHDLLHRLVRSHCPEYRLTPTNQRGIDLTGKVKDPHSYFAPFIVEPICAPDDRGYYKDGKINLFEIGKYQERKNHFMMVRVVERLKDVYPNIHLKIAGDCSDKFHHEYYDRLSSYITEHNLKEYVTLYTNLTKAEVGEIYKTSDLYILTSTQEPASITVIESMAYSVASLSGTDNGTADYIVPGVTGDVFQDCDEDDLYNKINRILSDTENIPRMGRAAYQHVCDHFQFKNYYDTVMQMIHDQDEEQSRDK